MNKGVKLRVWTAKKLIYIPDEELDTIQQYLIKTGNFNIKEERIYQRYTGKEDMDGKEIYEGDLVSLHYAGNNKAPAEAAGLYEVFYEGASFKLKEIKHNWFTTHFTNPRINDNLPDGQPRFMIIDTAPLENFGICRIEGNIYEN